MNPLEIKKALRTVPFIPFRLHLSSGKDVDVLHPEMALLTAPTLHIAHPVEDPTEDIPDQADAVSLLHVVRLELLTASGSSTQRESSM